MSSRSLAGIASRIPAQVLIVTSALIQYSGAAVAVFAFSVVEPASVAWWRGFVGALVLCAWVRPWRGLDRATLKGAFYFGIALVCMNACFYEAISRIPLGAAVSLEFPWSCDGCCCTRPWLGAKNRCLLCLGRGVCDRRTWVGFECSENLSWGCMDSGGRRIVGNLHRVGAESSLVELCDD